MSTFDALLYALIFLAIIAVIASTPSASTFVSSIGTFLAQLASNVVSS